MQLKLQTSDTLLGELRLFTSRKVRISTELGRIRVYAKRFQKIISLLKRWLILETSLVLESLRILFYYKSK